jgi:hypothetical protein
LPSEAPASPHGGTQGETKGGASEKKK